MTDDLTGDFFAGGGPARVAAARLAGELPGFPAVPGLRYGAPIARPQAVFCIGLNYAAHAAEANAPRPDEPILFFKTPNTIGGPDDDIDLLPDSEKTDWEVELGVVIGRPAHRLADTEAAREVIAGYVLADDVSEREFQLERSGGQWGKGKIGPGFTPLGPYLVTPDELDASELRIRSWVNGEPRQDSTTADLIFSVPAIIHHLSQFARLEPGDLVLTGTPEGVALSGRFPYLSDGDVVETEIEGLGRQTHRFRAATPA